MEDKYFAGIMASSSESLKAQEERRVQHLSHHKLFFDNEKNTNKENVDPKTERMTGLMAVKPVGRSTRLKSDSMIYDGSLRNMELQDLNISPNLSTMSKVKDVSLADKDETQFRKTKFSVYDDNVKVQKRLDVHKSILNKSSEKLPKVPDKVAPLKGLSIRESNKAPLAQKLERDDQRILKKYENVLKPSLSPNSSSSSQMNLVPIKKVHKNSKRTPRSVYDCLSLELAYNINYMDEYVRFQILINEKKRLSSNFLMKSVTANQRRLIVKYLISAAAYHKYPSFILYQAVKIFDFYIDVKEVDMIELQPSALAALWIALKRDLTLDDVPEASEIMKLARGPSFKENKKPLVEYEKAILMALKFEISFADPFSMLALYTIMIEEVRELDSIKVQQLYYCGSYLIDLSLLNDKMLNITAVHLAAISAEITLVLNMEAEKKRNDSWSYWRKKLFEANPILEKYRLSDGKMNCLRNQLMRTVILSKDSETDFHVVHKKYSKQRYGPVSSLIVSKVSTQIVSKSSDLKDPLQPMIF
ncbi:hypothetical protein QAD02_017690 [Eretmocerus hayati]|uniref:Uncharacterized protein n=1 Tax=Eretmocerus hayati TaxID=131215 RepID=A0ACC2PFR9_9HYME|nr:hypothetical protein QAD02_017690 [Eretmocerus hayati]